MGTFLNKLHASLPEEGGEWVLDEPLVFQSDLLGTITVPKGFTTDFASVPRLPIAYSLFGDVAHAPAVIHDYLYCATQYHRGDCDDVFLEAMKAVGIPWWRRRTMWSAVRLFGGFVRKSNE